MNLTSVGIIYRKELMDALRDRRTIISTIVVPMLMFPLLTIVFGSLAARSIQKVEREGSTIMLLGETNAPALAQRIRAADGIRVVPPSDAYVALISDKKLRCALEFPPRFEADVKGNRQPGLKIYHFAGEMRSQIAVRAVQKILRDYRDQIIEMRLAEGGFNNELLKPFASREENVAPPEKVGGNVIGGLFPYMIIFLCFMGALAPAIDLTAGEKERGTIESILASPVSRADLVLGKFLMVFTASIVTAVVSLTSFALTFSLPFLAAREIARKSQIPFDLSVTGVAAVLLMMLPLAVMFASALMSVGLWSKTTKEAHSYASPLMLLVLMPAMAAMVPGFDLNAKLALVPVLNVSLVSKEVLTGNYPWLLLGLVFGSSCAYAAGALSLAAAAFKRESVLFRV
jgi:sodium transport system permease protein